VEQIYYERTAPPIYAAGADLNTPASKNLRARVPFTEEKRNEILFTYF